MRRAVACFLSIAVNALLWAGIAFVGISMGRGPDDGGGAGSAPYPVRVARADRPERRPARRKPVPRQERPRERAPAPVARPAPPPAARPADRPALASLARASFAFDRMELAPLAVGALEIVGGPASAAAEGDGPAGAGEGGGAGEGIGARRGSGPRIPPSVIYRPDSSAFYPSEARLARIEGAVRVRLLVDERGSVTRAEILSASPRGTFDAAALRYAKTWRFAPAREGDRSIPMWCEVTIRFTRGGEP